MCKLLLFFCPLLLAAASWNHNPCTDALSFDSIRTDRLRSELGHGSLIEQVKVAQGRLRALKNGGQEILQWELAEQWRDYAGVLESDLFFRSYEIHIGKDIIFTGGKVENKYYFIAITDDVPAQLYYGVRDTPIDRQTAWREGNTRFEAW